MKNILLISITVILCLAMQKGLAQSFKAKPIIGVTASHVIGDTKQGYNYFGGVAGMGVSLDLAESFEIQQEAVYYMRGSKPRPEENSQYRIRMNYVDINTVAAYQFVEQFGIEGGLGLGLLTFARLRSSSGFENDMVTARSTNLNALIGVRYLPSDRVELFARMLQSIFSATTDAKWHRSLSLGCRVVL